VAKRARSEERGPSARLFVALDLPADARSRLVAWRDEALADRPDLRPVAPAALHVTLAFIGHRPEPEVEAIGAAVAGAARGFAPARLRPLGVAPVPPRRPRLFAFDLDDAGGHAAAVQAALSEALATGGFYEPERRPFWPHITFARVRRGERADAIEADPPSDPFEAAEVTLYRSRLSPRGASYEPLVRAELA
jgi:2'-5' RNA ligase